MNEKTDSKQNENDIFQNNRKMIKEQILIDELKKEILDEGLFILAVSLLIGDCDL